MRNKKGQFVKGISFSPQTQFKKGQVSPRKGVRLPDDVKKKISDSKKGFGSFTGKKHTKETKEKISRNRVGKTAGENHPQWIKDRSKLAKRQQRNDMAYKEWRQQVWKRDGFKCRIANENCKGRIEAHHILGWAEYVELRYEINNGITLCHAHHPRTRKSESELSPYFKKLVAEVKSL